MTAHRLLHVLILSLLTSLQMSACSPWNRLDVISQRLFTPLSDKDLNEFEQRLAHLKRSGATGDALIVATQWLYLLTCHPIPYLDPPDDPLWRALYASLYLEESRPPTEQGHLAPLIKGDSDALKLDPKMLPEALWMTWPKDVEGWPDEAPLHIPLPRICQGELGRRTFDPLSGLLLPTVTAQRVNAVIAPPSPPPSPGVTLLFKQIRDLLLPKVEESRRLFWRASAHLGWGLSALSSLSEVNTSGLNAPQKSLLDSWRWWLNYNIALTLNASSQVELGWPPRAEHHWAGRMLYRLACQRWEGLAEGPPPIKGRGATLAVTQATLMWGLCLEERGQAQRALSLWRDQSFSILAGESVELVNYHRLRLLSALGLWREASSLRERLPPPRSKLYPAFAYGLGNALQNAGDERGLMALSTEVFRDRSWRRDPFLRGLFYLFIRGLTRYDFESRVIELLEDLGPRLETYDRVRVFAEVSLDEAQPAQAREATTWLLDQRTRGRERFRLYELIAHAALLELDTDSFTQALRAISGLKSKSVKAIPKGRRGRFFKDRDQALTRLLQRLLPLVAEWPMSSTRGVWLSLMLSEVQLFLRTRPESRSRAELTELYRVGKSMLSARNRLAYAEKVGRKTPESLVLGQVRVRAANVSPFEPREVSLKLAPPFVMTLIPSGPLSPLSWSLEWQGSR